MAREDPDDRFAARTLLRGLRLRFFEDFKVGDIYRHAIGRTLSEADNTGFSLLTCNIHINADYASHTEFGRPLMNSA